MSFQVLLTYITGVIFLTALLGIACIITFRTKQNPIPSEAMFIFRVILSLASAGFAVMLTGFIEIEGKILSLSVKAGGALAVFVIVYFVNPPDRFKKHLPKLGKPRIVDVSDDRIKEDDKIV